MDSRGSIDLAKYSDKIIFLMKLAPNTLFLAHSYGYKQGKDRKRIVCLCGRA
jgi:hypothetical protein